MREIVFDLIVFGVGISIGVVLACYLFERKRRDMIEAIDASLDTIGIKRSEYKDLLKRMDKVEFMIKAADQAPAAVSSQ